MGFSEKQFFGSKAPDNLPVADNINTAPKVANLNRVPKTELPLDKAELMKMLELAGNSVSGALAFMKERGVPTARQLSTALTGVVRKIADDPKTTVQKTMTVAKSLTANLAKGLAKQATGLSVAEAGRESRKTNQTIATYDELMSNLLTTRQRMLETPNNERDQIKAEFKQLLTELKAANQSLPKEEAAKQRQVIADILRENRTRKAELADDFSGDKVAANLAELTAGIERSKELIKKEQLMIVKEKGAATVSMWMTICSVGLGAGVALGRKGYFDAQKRKVTLERTRHKEHAKAEADRTKVDAKAVILGGIKETMAAAAKGDTKALINLITYVGVGALAVDDMTDGVSVSNAQTATETAPTTEGNDLKDALNDFLKGAKAPEVPSVTETPEVEPTQEVVSEPVSVRSGDVLERNDAPEPMSAPTEPVTSVESVTDEELTEGDQYPGGAQRIPVRSADIEDTKTQLTPEPTLTDGDQYPGGAQKIATSNEDLNVEEPEVILTDNDQYPGGAQSIPVRSTEVETAAPQSVSEFILEGDDQYPGGAQSIPMTEADIAAINLAEPAPMQTDIVPGGSGDLSADSSGEVPVEKPNDINKFQGKSAQVETTRPDAVFDGALETRASAQFVTIPDERGGIDTLSEAIYQEFKAGRLEGLPEGMSKKEFLQQFYKATAELNGNEKILELMSVEGSKPLTDFDLVFKDSRYNVQPLLDYMNGASIEQVENGIRVDVLETGAVSESLVPAARPDTLAVNTNESGVVGASPMPVPRPEDANEPASEEAAVMTNETGAVETSPFPVSRPEFTSETNPETGVLTNETGAVTESPHTIAQPEVVSEPKPEVEAEVVTNETGLVEESLKPIPRPENTLGAEMSPNATDVTPDVIPEETATVTFETKPEPRPETIADPNSVVVEPEVTEVTTGAAAEATTSSNEMPGLRAVAEQTSLELGKQYDLANIDQEAVIKEVNERATADNLNGAEELGQLTEKVLVRELIVNKLNEMFGVTSKSVSESILKLSNAELSQAINAGKVASLFEGKGLTALQASRYENVVSHLSSGKALFGNNFGEMLENLAITDQFDVDGLINDERFRIRAGILGSFKTMQV